MTSATWLRGLAVWFALASSACLGRSGVLCKDTQCVVAGSSPADAVLLAASAVAVFSVVGCKINGCEFPYECNETTKRCERLHCSEAEPCPGGYVCDPQKLRCW